jgi:hypothetical protein
MKIKRNEDIKGIKIEHNRVLFWIIIFLIIVLISVIFIIVKNNKFNKEIECGIDSECIPQSCCHSNSCVPITQKPNCSGTICSMECSGPLDCNQGYCSCIKNKCELKKR